MAASIGAAGSAQRTNALAPDSGTLNTAPVAAWTPSTAYTLAPRTQVTNAGNLYQCRTAGTSASSGGPTTTAADITDGTAHWTFIGAAPSANTNAGSVILVSTARGKESSATPTAPSDNDSGSYTSVQLHSYAGFAASVAAVYKRNTVSNSKTGFSSGVSWGAVGVAGSGGDEITNTFVEVRGVLNTVHTSSHVERTNGTGPNINGAQITTTVPCIVLSWWFGNGNVITSGTSHTATPTNGGTEIPGAKCLMALSNNGYIQQNAAFWIVNTPGNFTATWQTVAEGAQVVTIALPLDTITATGSLGAADATVASAVQVKIAASGAASAADATVTSLARVTDRVAGALGAADATVSGAAQVKIAAGGAASAADATVTSAAQVKIAASGAAGADATVSGSVSLSGATPIVVSGNPSSADATVTGSAVLGVVNVSGALSAADASVSSLVSTGSTPTVTGISWANVVSIIPEMAGVGLFAQTLILALTNSRFAPDSFDGEGGPLLTMVRVLFAAHMAMMVAPPPGTGTAGGTAGPVASESGGGLSISYASMARASEALSETSFGRTLLDLIMTSPLCRVYVAL